MLDCISVDTMRRSDAYTIANFVPSLELMYRAAYGVFLSCDWIAPVAVVVGSGNNGETVLHLPVFCRCTELRVRFLS